VGPYPGTVRGRGRPGRVPEEAKYQYINGQDTAQIILDIGQAFDSLGQVGIERLQGEVEKDLIWFEPPPGVSVIQTGEMAVMNTVIGALTTGRIRMTLLGLVLIFFILLVIYRDLVKAVLPVLPMFFVIGWMGGVMYVSGMKYNPMTATLGALILGVGSEYAILTMERFYEEKEMTEMSWKPSSRRRGASGLPSSPRAHHRLRLLRPHSLSFPHYQQLRNDNGPLGHILPS
jgi:predicted RND superfamily exporter protein